LPLMMPLPCPPRIALARDPGPYTTRCPLRIHEFGLQPESKKAACNCEIMN
jgi:hypothetical protein